MFFDNVQEAQEQLEQRSSALQQEAVGALDNVFNGASNSNGGGVRYFLKQDFRNGKTRKYILLMMKAILWSQRVKGRSGPGAAGKTLVFGLLKRVEKIFTKIISDAKSKNLMPINYE